MQLEIERKFLVKKNWPRIGRRKTIRQGYLSTDKNRTVRVRLENERGLITIKGMPEGLARPEFEYTIPGEDAAYLLDHLCRQPVIEKTRYIIDYEGRVWEIDEFHGDNQGLIIAEIELGEVSAEVPLPDWIGEEVTGDPRFYNANLIGHPYKEW